VLGGQDIYSTVSGKINEKRLLRIKAQNEKMKVQKEEKYFLDYCQNIKEKHELVGLGIHAHWWSNPLKIKLKKDKEYLRPEHFIFIKNVSIHTIINKLKSKNKTILEKKELFQKDLDLKRTCRIIKHWQKKERLIPPTIIWNDENCIEIADGRHRLNTAFCLGENNILIMVPNDLLEVQEVMDYLKIAWENLVLSIK
jgi:hypothetical protein